MSQQSQHTPLGSIDANIQIANTNPFNPLNEKSVKPVPAFMQESRQHQSLHARLLGQERSGKQAGAYVSPSDDILSPASAKLNSLKEKRFAKTTAKPRTLFAKTTSMNAELSGESFPSTEKK